MELFLEQVKRIALLDTESPKQYLPQVDIWNPNLILIDKCL